MVGGKKFQENDLCDRQMAITNPKEKHVKILAA